MQQSQGKTDIGDFEKFQLASIVNKNSRSGITSNKRLLVIKRGQLYYYSTIPKFFKGDPKTLESFHELPKCSIEIVNIKQVKGFQPSSSYFSIQFDAKHMMEREDIRKTMTIEEYNFAPKSTSEAITWQFTCDNQFIKQRWVTALLTLKQQYTREKANMQNFFEKINMEGSSRNSVKIPWRESLIKRQDSSQSSARSPQSRRESLKPAASHHKPSSIPIIEPIEKKQSKRGSTDSFESIENAFKVSSKGAPKEAPAESKAMLVSPILEDSEQNVPQTPQTLRDEIKGYSDSEQSYCSRKVENVLQLDTPKSIVHEYEKEFQKKPQRQSEIATVSPEKPKQQSRIMRTPKEERKGAGCEFRVLLGEGLEPSKPFGQRFRKQMSLSQHMALFRERATEQFKEYVETQGRSGKYVELQRSSSLTVVEIGQLLMKVGVVATQNMIINDKPKIYFNEEAIKNLKREFKVYQDLFLWLCTQLKGGPTRLSVPLVLFLEYKGSAALIFRRTNAELSIPQQTLMDEYPEQLELLRVKGYDPDWFIFKTLGDFLVVQVRWKGKNLVRSEEALKEHLSRMVAVGQKEKHHKVVFEPPIDSNFLVVAARDGASTSIASLQNYIAGLEATSNFEGVCPKQEITTALKLCLFCKQLRKIYRSAQGEINETHFFSLVLNRHESILTLLKQASCTDIPPATGQLFSFIEHYFGVSLNFDPEDARKINSTTVRPIYREYSLEHLEICRAYDKLGWYIQSGQIELARKELQVKQQVLGCNFEVLYDWASLLFAENDFLGCIKNCMEMKQMLGQQSSRLFSVYLLMMKAYAQFSESEMTNTFKSAVELLAFNYGIKNSSLINLYCLSGFYYNQLSSMLPSDAAVKCRAIAIRLVKEAQELCTYIFGQASFQQINVLLDLSKLHRSSDRSLSLKYFTDARCTFQKYQKLRTPETTTLMLTSEVELCLHLGLLEDCERSLLKLIGTVDTNTPPKVLRPILRLEHEFGLFAQKSQYCKAAIEELWKMDSTDRVEALQLAWKLALKEETYELEEIGESTGNTESPSMSLLHLEGISALHEGVFEMVKEAVQSKNQKVLGLIHKAIGRGDM